MNTPTQLSSGMYQCECGAIAHFPDALLSEARDRSFRKVQWLADDSLGVKHHLVFADGQVIRMLCPVAQDRPLMRGTRFARHVAVAAGISAMAGAIALLLK